MSRTHSLGLLALAFVSLATRSSAQCGGWQAFGATGFDQPVEAYAVHDDGSGPVLYAGGRFTTAGGVAARHVAKWDGTHWSAVGNGLENVVQSLQWFDDGSGPKLYAGLVQFGGSPSSVFVARWDGATWSQVGAGLGDAVESLAVYDDGTGPHLYAGGFFSTGVARWSGSTWTLIGAGQGVYSLASFDDGSGAKLYAGGDYSWFDGGVLREGIARWNGSSWSSVGGASVFPTSSYEVRALAVHDDGSGPALYMGGQFTGVTGASASNIARWDGTGWSAVGAGIPSSFAHVNALAVCDDGGGAALYAGGLFSTGALHNVAKWNGSTWSSPGSGTSGGSATIDALAAYPQGASSVLCAGGWFTQAGGTSVNYAARWDGTNWNAFGAPGVLDGPVRALAVWNDGSGQALYVGGQIHTAGTVAANGVARYDGASWSALGSGVAGGGGAGPFVASLATFDDGGGSKLYVGGYFTSAGGVPASAIARWDGAAWSPVGSGMSGSLVGPIVSALAVYDDGSGPALYAAGTFVSPGGNIARWNGSSWSSIGGVGGGHSGGGLSALAVFDDGSGPKLYAAGVCNNAGGVPVSNIARWNGTSWSDVGGGVTFDGFTGVSALARFDGGSGPALYVGGAFPNAGGVVVNGLARWNGTSWSAVGSGVAGSSSVSALGVFDAGLGPNLYVSGGFTIAGGSSASHLARWDGASWSRVDAGTNDFAAAMAVWNDGVDAAPDLFLGGYFTTANGLPSSFVAELHGCTMPTFCLGDGTGTVCPCGNASTNGGGCTNSFGAGGTLSGTGVARLSADTLVLHGDHMANSSALYFQGSATVNGGNGAVFGDGLRCAGGSVIRIGTQTNVAGSSQYPLAGDPAISVKGAVPVAGATRFYQCDYRDNGSFCTAQRFNLTNGLAVTWIP